MLWSSSPVFDRIELNRTSPIWILSNRIRIVPGTSRFVLIHASLPGRYCDFDPGDVPAGERHGGTFETRSRYEGSLGIAEINR